MKAKRGARRSNTTIVVIVIGVILISLGVWAGVDYTVKNWAGYLWDKASIEKSLGVPIPVDANHVEFRGHRGRGGKLDLTFDVSYESMDAFISQFCGGKLYQGYDPFNAIDTKERREGAYLIIIEEFYHTIRYYSHSPNTSNELFGIRCWSPIKGQIQILVDKTSNDVALVKLELQFSCYKCNIPEPTPTSVPSQKS